MGPLLRALATAALGLAVLALLALVVGLRLAPAPAHADPPAGASDAEPTAAPSPPAPVRAAPPARPASPDAAWRPRAGGPVRVAPGALARAAAKKSQAGHAAACAPPKDGTGSTAAAVEDPSRCPPDPGPIESVEVDWHAPAATP